MARLIAVLATMIFGVTLTAACGGDDTYPIFFQSDRGGSWEIYSIQHDGSMETQVTDHFADDIYPAVSPDGTRLVFIRKLGDSTDIIMMDVDEQEETNLTNGRAGGTFESVTWFPDNERLLLTRTSPIIADGRPQLYWMYDTGIASDETGLFPLNQDPELIYRNPRVSSDGRSIAVAAGTSLESLDVHVLDAEARLISVVPQDTFLRPTGEFRAAGAAEDYPEFAPNERDLLIQSNAAATSNTSKSLHLWQVTSAGLRSTDLTPDVTYNNMQPSWSNELDAFTIVFVSDRDGNNEIYLRSLSAVEETRLTNNAASDTNPSWLKDDGEDD